MIPSDENLCENPRSPWLTRPVRQWIDHWAKNNPVEIGPVVICEKCGASCLTEQFLAYIASVRPYPIPAIQRPNFCIAENAFAQIFKNAGAQDSDPWQIECSRCYFNRPEYQQDENIREPEVIMADEDFLAGMDKQNNNQSAP